MPDNSAAITVPQAIDRDRLARELLRVLMLAAQVESHLSQFHCSLKVLQAYRVDVERWRDHWATFKHLREDGRFEMLCNTLTELHAALQVWMIWKFELASHRLADGVQEELTARLFCVRRCVMHLVTEFALVSEIDRASCKM